PRAPSFRAPSPPQPFAEPAARSAIRKGETFVSGHSKWSSIKHKKGAADAKRGQLFSKLSRAIIVAAREGGPDPAANLALQNAIANLASVREALVARGSAVESAGLTMVTKTTVEVADESAAKKVLRLIDQLEDSDDVQDVFSNFDIPEQVLEAVAS